MSLSKRLRDAWEAFSKIDKPKLADTLYICDRNKCTNCSYPRCKHTADITHAANFANECGFWIEKDKEEVMFNAKKVKDDIVLWIKNWFEKNGPGCNAVIGISGGKDSTVVAALCREALGKDRVIGVMMPDGEQSDIDVSKKVIKYLGIRGIEVNIKGACDSVICSIMRGAVHNPEFTNYDRPSDQTLVNLPPRIRMATLYAISQSVNGRVSCNGNLSEDYVGYFTRWADGVGDFAPLANLTVTEVKAIGRELGLPAEFIEKVPSDGLCGKTDEDNLGFTYDVLDRYIRTGECEDAEVKEKIDKLHEKNLFKMQPIPTFRYYPESAEKFYH